MRLRRLLADAVLVGLPAWCSGCLWGLTAKESSSGGVSAPPGRMTTQDRILMVAVLDDLRPPGAQGLQGHADALLLIRRTSGGLQLLAIPRDTWLERAGCKANGLNWRLPPREARLALGHALGIRIDGHVVMTLDAVARILDGLGGTTINVTHALHDEDRTAGWNISIPAGHRRLDGPRTVQWLRYRGEGTDLDRMRRLAELSPRLVRALPDPVGLIGLATALSGTWSCDEPVTEWASWRTAGRRRIAWHGLPGRPERLGGRWVWRARTDDARQLLGLDARQSR